MDNYLVSNFKKFESLFWKEDISNVIFIYDKEDDVFLDQVLFFEKSNGHVVGVYINGMNPYLSINHIQELDDFNLYASYNELMECNKKGFAHFKIRLIWLIFNFDYNELCGLYLGSEDEKKSIFLIFMHNEFYLEIGCAKTNIKRLLSEKLLQISIEKFIVYEKNSCDRNWEKIKLL